MLVYVVSERRRPRRAWLWLARRTLNRAVGRGGPALATCLTLSRSVTAGVGLVAAGTGGAVMIRLGDTRREVELRDKRIPQFPVDPDEFVSPFGPRPDAP